MKKSEKEREGRKEGRNKVLIGICLPVQPCDVEGSEAYPVS
jgi:hypothetical protein